MIRHALCLVLGLAAFLAWAVAPAPAQYHSAKLQTRYDYWPGGHWKGQWYAAGYYPVKVLVEEAHCPPAKIIVNPDVYYSTADHYRDQALIEAVTAKVQEALKQSAPAQVGERELILKLTEQLLRQQQTAQPVQAPAPVSQLPPPDPPPVDRAKRREVYAGRHQDQALAKVVNDHCARCHGPNKADASLALMTAEGALADVPEGLLWKSFALVTSGEMPKHGTPLGDKAVELFYAWAKAAGKRAENAPDYFPLGLASVVQHTPPRIVLEVQQDHYGQGQALRLRSYQQAPVLEIREVRPRRFLRFKQPPPLEIREVRPIKRQRLLLIEQQRRY